MKHIYVFDLGGTLMEYNGMPLNWSEYYFSGISKINKTFSLNLPDEKLFEATEILKSLNPRICGRQNEILAKDLFTDATKNWNVPLNITQAIEIFFKDMKLTPVIYDYSIPLIAKHFNQAVSSIIFIGDEQKDIDCAKNAGCEFVNIKEFVKNFVS